MTPGSDPAGTLEIGFPDRRLFHSSLRHCILFSLPHLSSSCHFTLDILLYYPQSVSVSQKTITRHIFMLT